MSSGLGATSGTSNGMLNFNGDGNAQSYPFVGLANRQYYTCFMNSILQSLLATPNLIPALCSLKSTPKLNKRSQYKGKISSQLIEFIHTYQNAAKQNQASTGSNNAVDIALRRFHGAFSDCFSQF